MLEVSSYEYQDREGLLFIWSLLVTFFFQVVGLLGEHRATAESVAQLEVKTIIADMPLEDWTVDCLCS